MRQRLTPLRSAALFALLCAAAVAASPASAAQRAIFHADIHATVTTNWERHHAEAGCTPGSQLTENGSGSQTLVYRVTHKRVAFTFTGPGQAQFRTAPISLRGTFKATRNGSDVTTDPGCGINESDPADGCGSYRGPATVMWSWPVSPSSKLFLDGAPVSQNGIQCPYFDTNGSMALFGLPLPQDGAPFAHYTPLKLAHFVFHTRRGRLTWHATKTWTVKGPMTDPGDVDQATNKMSWTVTLHRAH
ncbi:MAG TPA: hypothetical protein VJU60_05430 [Thermoleophilaceae bacterium]|nr:hypothetical protein [Thermoleophilaceae bacterium]